ncbi:MAG TPA: nitroreductase family protein [Anaerolineales bacterium]|nr:nitroreductase family protein [Anaerolineales bacterium]
MTGEELQSFLRTRRSVRRFKPESVPGAILERILETATYAPSAHNRQPWRFAVVAGVEAKTRLAAAITGRFRRDMAEDGKAEADIQARIERTLRRTNEAPVIVVLCRDATAVDDQPDEAGRLNEIRMGEQSVALAGLQLLLAAHAEGLAGTWICWPLFAPEETRRVLELSGEWDPQGMIFLGYPNESPESPVRKPLSELVKFVDR